MNENDLVKQYEKELRAVCKKAMRSVQGSKEIHIDEADLLQEARIALIGAIRRFDESRAVLFWTFAERCIHNRLSSWIGEERRQARLKVKAEYLQPYRSTVNTPEEQARENELWQKLTDMVAEISEEDGKVWADRFLGEPSRIAAAELDVTPAAVRLRLARLQSKIRKAVT